MRYHSLDGLRAAMMLLGLVLHSAASYTQTPLREAWPFHDPPGSVAFDIALVFIHLFRMPAFFVVGGFFAALLLYRDGAAGLIRNRTRRVALPLVVFAVTALPLAGLGFLLAARLEGHGLSAELVPQGPLLRRPILGHLWFLYYLLIFYAGSLLLVPAALRLPEGIRTTTRRIFERHAVTLHGALLLGLVTALTLVPMIGPGLETSASLLPPVRILVAYAVFFSFGFILYRHREHLIPAFGGKWGRCLALGMAMFVAYFVVLIAQPRMQPTTWHLTAILFAGPAMWLLIFGLLGWFVRRLSTPRPMVRYLSDASYWMYLTHLVPITWTSAALARAQLPAAVKFAIVLGVTTAITLATYHWWVRFTRLGVMLNGTRKVRRTLRVSEIRTEP